MNHNTPKITVVRDFDGYFEKLVYSWVAKKACRDEQFKHKEIQINSGPYKLDAVTTQSTGDVLGLDFYSAIRVGFGSLSDSDVEAIMELL